MAAITATQYTGPDSGVILANNASVLGTTYTRVSMGLTFRRETSKKLTRRRKNDKK